MDKKLCPLSNWTSPHTVPVSCWGGCGEGSRFCASRRSLDPVAAWLVPVAGREVVFRPHGPCSPRLCTCGLCVGPPCRLFALTASSCQVWPGKRQQINYLFLRIFFISWEMDFLFISKTWLSVDESIVLTKLLNDECCFFNSPWTSG